MPSAKCRASKPLEPTTPMAGRLRSSGRGMTKASSSSSLARLEHARARHATTLRKRSKAKTWLNEVPHLQVSKRLQMAQPTDLSRLQLASGLHQRSFALLKVRCGSREDDAIEK